MHNVKLAIWIILIVLIQSLLGTYIKIGTIMPDFLFSFLICYVAMLSNKNERLLKLCYSNPQKKILKIMLVAIICGAASDCMSGRIFGNYLSVFLIFAVIVYIIKDCINENFIPELLVDMILVFGCSLFGKSIFFLVNINALKNAGYFYSLVNIILPEALYNTAISLALIPLIRKSFKERAGMNK